MVSRLPWEQDTTGFDSPVPDWSVEDIPGVCRFARDFAKVADQVRFLTGVLNDGGYGVVASACDTVTVAVPDRNRLPTLILMARPSEGTEALNFGRVGSTPALAAHIGRRCSIGRAPPS